MQWSRALLHAARSSGSWQHAIAFDFEHLSALDQFHRVTHREKCSLGIALKPVGGQVSSSSSVRSALVTEATEAARVEVGSFLVAVNEKEVHSMGGFESVTRQLAQWRPPLVLMFLRPFKYHCTLNVRLGGAASIVWTSCEVILDAGSLFYVPARTREGRALSVMPPVGGDHEPLVDDGTARMGPAVQFDPSTGKFVLDPTGAALGKRASRVPLKTSCLRKAHRREVMGRANCFVLVGVSDTVYMQAESRAQRLELVGLLLRARQYETGTTNLARDGDLRGQAARNAPSPAPASAAPAPGSRPAVQKQTSDMRGQLLSI